MRSLSFFGRFAVPSPARLPNASRYALPKIATAAAKANISADGCSLDAFGRPGKGWGAASAMERMFRLANASWPVQWKPWKALAAGSSWPAWASARAASGAALAAAA